MSRSQGSLKFSSRCKVETGGHPSSLAACSSTCCGGICGYGACQSWSHAVYKSSRHAGKEDARAEAPCIPSTKRRRKNQWAAEGCSGSGITVTGSHVFILPDRQVWQALLFLCFPVFPASERTVPSNIYLAAQIWTCTRQVHRIQALCLHCHRLLRPRFEANINTWLQHLILLTMSKTWHASSDPTFQYKLQLMFSTRGTMMRLTMLRLQQCIGFLDFSNGILGGGYSMWINLIKTRLLGLCPKLSQNMLAAHRLADATHKMS
eukprot:1160777-Pelagomonas_calceolata.AAC.8